MSDLTPKQIAAATKAPLANVEANWPSLLDALKAEGIASINVQIGLAATVAAETKTFRPVREVMATDPNNPVYPQQQKYWGSGYYGRGYIQLTWERNYRAMGEALGLDLVKEPALALTPSIAARIAANFFKTWQVGGKDKRRIYQACEAADWEALRRGINGPKYAENKEKLKKFLDICQALEKGEGE